MTLGWRRNLTPYLLSGLIFALTLVAWFFTRSSLQLHNDARFESVADEVRDAVVERLQSYQNLLLETRGLFHAAPQLSRSFAPT
jgi:CHASE1-domain containing sensor protein